MHAYEDLIGPCSEQFNWPEFDENTGAALCYTSGTTGNPKGVLYSHRAIVLQAMAGCMPNVLSVSCRDTILPVVPMFHINAWCIPYGAPIAGAKLVLPGPRLDGESLYTLMEDEKVTLSAGVPSIWQGLIAYVEQKGLRFSTMRRTGVGGSAMPQALIAKFADTYQVEVRHGWGMTETTAVATMGTLTPRDLALPNRAATRHRGAPGQEPVRRGDQGRRRGRRHTAARRHIPGRATGLLLDVASTERPRFAPPGLAVRLPHRHHP